MQLFWTNSADSEPWPVLLGTLHVTTATILDVDGSRCATIAGLFDEWSTVLRFPDYFGRNWAAFDECLNDIHEWLGSTEILIIVSSAQRLLEQLAEEERVRELSILLRILAETTGDFLNEPSRDDLKKSAVLFSTVSSEAARFKRLIELIGVDIPEVGPVV